LQTSPSLHGVPFKTAEFEHPTTGSHESVVQTFESLQLRDVPEAQTPVWQVSEPLQTLPSGHGVPLTTGLLLQPKTGSQESVVQTLESLQLRAVPVEQTPAWQVSFPLQTLPSPHDVPFKTGVFEHPATGSQESVVQTLASLQSSAVPDVQLPV